MQYPPPNAQPPLQPVKKKGRGCIIVLAVLGVLTVLGIVAVVGFGYFVYSTPEGKRAANAAGEMASIMADALHAPGTKELRDLGCPQASVIDQDRMEAVTRKLDPDAAISTTREYRYFVVCGARVRGGPTCEEVASTYRAAVTPDRPFAVSVASSGSKIECHGVYAPDGTKIRDGVE